MDRFRRLLCTAVMLALLTSLAATPVMAKNRTITGRGIEQPGEGPGLDATGEPDDGGGSGLPREQLGLRSPRLIAVAISIQLAVYRATGITLEVDWLVRTMASGQTDQGARE